MCRVGIYLVCDYPDKKKFLNAVSVCEKYNIDFLEIGFPFSDPVADGPVIEKAALEVLEKENTKEFIESLKTVRDIFSKRLYVMTYANVIFGYSMEKFAAKVSFIDGIIVADLPFAEAGRFKGVFEKYNINIINFATPESSFEDINKIKKNSRDFIYFVSTRGITGGKFKLDDETKEKVLFSRHGFKGDVILGFGIKNREDIEEACKYSDGVVVGTQAVRALNEGTFENFIANLKKN